MGSKKSKMDVTLYNMGIHMGIGRAIDELVEIEVGKKKLWQGSITYNAAMTFVQRWLFGGDTKEGGIWGYGQMLFGKRDQPVSEEIARVLPGRLPAFRGIASFYYYGEICANSPYPKPWRFRVRNNRGGWDDDNIWYPEKLDIWQANGQIRSMNPAHILYKVLTGSDFRNLNPARLDQAAWRKFADQLYSEGFGLCMKWSRQSTIADFIQQVLDHVGGARYTDRHTGLLVPVLLRGGYNPDDLPLFTLDTGLLGVDEFSSDSIADGLNEIIVNYKDPLDRGNKRQVREKNLGAIHANDGQVRSTTIDYAGIPTAALARRVARRDLNALTGFVRRFKLRFDRRAASKVMPAGLIRISVPTLGIENMVLRLGAVSYGAFRDGEISADAVADVFGMPSTVYVPEEPSGHVPPNPNPVPIDNQVIMEVSYRDLAYNLGAAVSALEPESAFMAAIAERPSAMSVRYRLHSRIDGSTTAYVDQGSSIFCPVSVLAQDIDFLDTQINVSSLVDLSRISTGTAAMIDDEIVQVSEINELTGVLTITRGCVDTVPARHEQGATIWFYQDYGVYDSSEYADGTTLEVKLQPSTFQGELALDQVTPEAIELQGRAARPYAPGQFKINGVYYPAEIDVKDITISWAHRNRLTQAEQLINTLQDSITPEDNTQYEVAIYKADDNSLINKAVVSGTEHTFTTSQAGDIKVVLKAIRDGLESWQAHVFTFYKNTPVTNPLLVSRTDVKVSQTDILVSQVEY